MRYAEEAQVLAGPSHLVPCEGALPLERLLGGGRLGCGLRDDRPGIESGAGTLGQGY